MLSFRRHISPQLNPLTYKQRKSVKSSLWKTYKNGQNIMLQLIFGRTFNKSPMQQQQNSRQIESNVSQFHRAFVVVGKKQTNRACRESEQKASKRQLLVLISSHVALLTRANSPPFNTVSLSLSFYTFIIISFFRNKQT